MSQGTDEQTVILKEILKWIRFTAAKEVKAVLTDVMNTEQKSLIYHLSDGNRSSAEIGKSAGISDMTVRRLWASWARLGIVEAIKVRGGDRYKKSFDLENFGIEPPKTPALQTSVNSTPAQKNNGGKAE